MTGERIVGQEFVDEVRALALPTLIRELAADRRAGPVADLATRRAGQLEALVEAGSSAEWEADAVVPSSFPSFEELRRPERLGREILAVRAAARARYGDGSIEVLAAGDQRWPSILGAKVAHCITGSTGDLEGELVDVLAVASAWLDAVRRARVVSSDETGRSL